MGKQAEETREQRQARQHTREERKKEALALLGVPWPEPTPKGAGCPTFQDQYKAALYQAVKSDAPYLNQLSKEMPVRMARPGQPLVQEETVENQLEDIQSSAASAQVKDKQEAETKGEQKASVTSEQEAGVDKPPKLSASAFVFRLRPRTLSWRKYICSRTARIGQGQEPWST